MATQPTLPASISESSIKRVLNDLTTLYLKHRTKAQRALYLSLFIALISRIRSAISEQRAAAQRIAQLKRQPPSATTPSGKPPRVELNREFFRNLLRLLKIVISGWRSQEFRLLISQSIFLVIRTLLSLYVADLDGQLVSSLVRGRGKAFLRGLVWWMVIAVPATFTNSMLSFHQCKLALQYRTRLTEHIHTKYLSNMTFYSLSALDDRIKNADHLITADVSKFSNSLAELYSNLAKPVLDMAIYNWSLSRSVGGEGLFALGLIVQVSASLMRALTPPFGKYVAEEARLEGEFRHQHGRLIDFAEEIALYFGHDAEKDGLDKGYFTLIKHVNRILRRRFWHGFMEDYVLKYVWSSLGLMLCSVPVFFKVPGEGRSVAGDRTGDFIRNRRMLLSSSDAFGRIMFSYKEIIELAGYTSRVAGLFDVIEDVQKGHFKKTLVSSADVDDNAAVLRGRGTVMEGENIEFDRVPIVSPNGDVLIKELSFIIRPGDHLLIVGPNGCGKSSLFRILGSLWPCYGGTVHKPSSTQIFLLPQRPYLPHGTLRDQLIYPDSLSIMHARNITDDDLLAHLSLLSISSLVTKSPSGFDFTSNSWSDILSIGMQQRIAMARMFYHRPKYAILDECTSSVTAEVEEVMYREAKRLGVTLMTVSHRRSLWRWHEKILQFDGQGGYWFGDLDAQSRLKLEDEKEELDLQLRAVPDIERRIAELTV